MTTFKFSETVGCFYPDDIEYPNPPDDLIDVLPGEYEKVMSRRPDQTFNHMGGGEFEIVDIPVPLPGVPQKVTKFQAKAALHLSGLLETVEQAIQADQTDFLTKLAWNEVNSFERTSSMVLSLSRVLGLTEQQLDDLFILASTIN